MPISPKRNPVSLIISELAEPGAETEEETTSTDADAMAKLLEELKLMVRETPLRIEDMLTEITGFRQDRKKRRFHPMMIEDMMHMGEMGRDEPLMIVVFASLVRDDAPWLYEIAMEAYRAIISGTQKSAEQIRKSIKMLRDFPMHSPTFEKLMMTGSKESHMLMMEGPHTLERMVMKCLENRKNR